MSEAWKELLNKQEEKKVEFETAFGKVEFVVKLPTWVELARIDDECTIIDPFGKTYKFDQVEQKRKRLMRCIVKHPFPQEQYEQCLMSLDPKVANKLLSAIDELIAGSHETAKNF